jgi:transketolase
LEYKNKSTLPVISTYKENMTDEDLKQLALQLRRDVIELTYYSGTKSSHVGGELSSADIMAVLYGAVLRVKPEDPDWDVRDRFIMSKGHCSGLTYAAMAWRGYFKRDKLFNEFNRVDGLLQEHANMELPGIEAPTGSLGMGLSNGCGMAYASRLVHRHVLPPYRVYVLLGDGECTEGQTWEGVMLARQLRLDNLVAIVDYNKYIISASTYEVMDLEPFTQKWEDFGWHVQRVNGHDIPAVRQALETAGDIGTAPGKPRVIIADTNKGMPISFMMKDAINWHAGHLDDALYQQCMKELGL